MARIGKTRTTGRLEYWWYDEKNNTIWGNCYDDIRGRWREGQFIHTSNIPDGKDKSFKEGDIVYTLNSTYTLGKECEEYV